MCSKQKKSSLEVDSLYCLKALCAFFVVILHSQIWGRDYIMPVLTCAVPCFFAISGYFLYSCDAAAEIRKSLRWIKKIMVLFLCLSCLYVAVRYVKDETILSWRNVRLFVLTGLFPSNHLWYLVSLAQALSLFSLFRRFKMWSMKVLWILLMLHFMYRSCLDCKIIAGHEYYFFQPLYSLFLVGIGYYASKNQIGKCPPLGFAVMLICAMLMKYLCICFEATLSRSTELVCNGVVPVCLLALCTRFPKCSIKFVAWIGKRHSANIYYYHMFVISILGWYCHKEYPCGYTAFVLTLLLSIVLEYIVHLVSKLNLGIGCG